MPPSATARQDTRPYWFDSASLPTFSRIDRDDRFDVVVIGGGITGLTAAYLLTAAGKTVALLERGRCAQVDTGHTTAHLTMVTDTRLTDLVNRFGRNHAQAVWDAGLAAISQIDAIIRKHRIDCAFEWVDGYLHAPTGQADRGQPDSFKEEAALARQLGFDAAFVDDVPLVGGAGIRFDSQARFHPRKYLAGLARAIKARGGRIYEHSDAEAFCDQEGRGRARTHSQGEHMKDKDHGGRQDHLDEHSLPGTNQAGTGPGSREKNDQKNRPSGRTQHPGQREKHSLPGTNQAEKGPAVGVPRKSRRSSGTNRRDRMARSVWEGRLGLSLVTCPVALHKATAADLLAFLED